MRSLRATVRPKDLATMEDSFIDPSWCYLPLFLQRFQEGNKDLVATHVGRGKDSLDAVDSNIGVAEAGCSTLWAIREVHCEKHR